SEQWKDSFLYNRREESQHVIVDEMEWRREHARLSVAETEQGVTDLIDLVAAVDGLLQLQASADTSYFVKACRRFLSPADTERIAAGVLAAYRWQYIVSGLQEPRFSEILSSMVTDSQATRMGESLAGIM